MIKGVEEKTLTYNDDDRGWLCEIYRRDLLPNIEAKQVNVMYSRHGSLRGSHIHREHTDYFFVASGQAVVGLKDVRKRSPTFGVSAIIDLDRRGLIVPAGIIHCVYFPSDCVLVTIESMHYDPEEELKIDWSDPILGFDLRFKIPRFPKGDKSLSYEELMERIEPWQSHFRV